MTAATAQARLQRLMQLSDAALSVPEAALVIASQQYPGLVVEDYLARIGATGAQLRKRLAADASKTHSLAMLNHLMFDELGYTGAEEEYYDPRNSFLNEVMERRRGIPITLSILYIAVGQSVGLHLEGVSFPGHFLVRCALDGGIVALDPFQRGTPLSEQDLRERLAARGLAGGTLGGYLQAARKREILSRLLRNLLAIYLQQQRSEQAIEIIDLMLVIQPDAPGELLTRARLYRELECYPAALRDAEHYARVDPLGAGNEEVQQLLRELRRAAPTLH